MMRLRGRNKYTKKGGNNALKARCKPIKGLDNIAIGLEGVAFKKIYL